MENRNYDLFALIGRILIASLFLISGLGKLTAPAGALGYIASAGLPLPTLAYIIALFVELVLPIVLVLGYKMRLTAVVLAIFAIVTALAFHLQLSDQSQSINFLKNLAIAGGLLQIAAFGGGKLSLDDKFRRDSHHKPLGASADT